jgi:hypothetical protein
MPEGNSTTCKFTIRFEFCSHRHHASSSRAQNSNTRSKRISRSPSSTKHAKQKQQVQLSTQQKQQQPQRQQATSKDKDYGCLQGTPLLEGQRLESIVMLCTSASRAHKSNLVNYSVAAAATRSHNIQTAVHSCLDLCPCARLIASEPFARSASGGAEQRE